MGKYNDSIPRRQTDADDQFGKAPRWPEFCQVEDCVDEEFLAKEKVERANKTDIAIVIVADQNGHIRKGPFSRFAKGKENAPYVLADGYQFRGWIARCSKCYMRELDRTGRSQLTPSDQHEFLRSFGHAP